MGDPQNGWYPFINIAISGNLRIPGNTVYQLHKPAPQLYIPYVLNIT